MALTTVNKLSDDAVSAIRKLCEEDCISWLQLEKYEGKIGMYDDDEDIHFTLKEGLEELISYLDYEVADHETLTDDEFAAFEALCDLLHVDY